MGEVALNDDVLAEIFLRASGEFVFRCKCLSKQWNLYLSSPLFRRKYLSRLRKLGLETLDIVGCFKDGYDTKESTPAAASFHAIGNGGFVGASSCIKNLGSFVACSNGLVLLRSCCNNNIYLVCNPFTDKAIELPQPKRIYQPELVITSFHYYGEDYDEECARFSVVRAYPNHGHIPSSSVSIEIYSSETGVWKESTLTGPQPFLIASVSEAHSTSITRRDNIMVYWHAADPGVIVAYDLMDTHDSVWLIELPVISEPLEAVVCESQGLLMCAVNHQPGLLTVKILPNMLHDYSYAEVVPASEWSPYSHFGYCLTPYTYPQQPHPRFVTFWNPDFVLVKENGYLYTVNVLTRHIFTVGYVPNDYCAPYIVLNWPWPPSIP